MKSATGMSASWADASPWPPIRKSPAVVVLAGIDSSEIVDAALADTALTEAAMPRFEPACTPPCDALLWRLETASGESLNRPGLLDRHWHRRPYAMTLRLVEYQAGSAVPEILDEGTIGTRGPRTAFMAAADRLAMRFVRDAALGRGRGPAGMLPAAAASGLPGWLDAMQAKWHARLTAEWWSIGNTTVALDHVLSGNGLGDITWYRTKAGHRYLADPFPWPGTNRILCEEMPLRDGVGRIVAVAEADGTLTPPTVLLDDGHHHSYPCTFRDGQTVYCVPESTLRGTTRIYRLNDDGRLIPVCDPAPHFRLADPTLFGWDGRYWLACTDLDLGGHDNLCLLHAPAPTGPWTTHARWPVKIDVRGARPAGMLFSAGDRLFRPGQDCSSTYGAAVAIHEILVLNETDFAESLVTVLRPDQTGPFPHGLHTLVHDGERFWVDGKRFVLDLGLFRQKILGRASHIFSKAGVG
ncbi:MAG: hypothetical protein P4L90_02345 [Rhodopila sp.]|nr:hypothetical protein [Rhodopila sp.]